MPYVAKTGAGIPVTADTFVFSLYAKTNGRNQVCLSLYGGGGNKYISAVYGLIGGTVSKTQSGSSGTLVSTSITPVGDGWYRIAMTGSITAPAGVVQAYAYLTNSATPSLDAYGTPAAYTGDGTSGIYVWGASLVPASDASLPYQRVNTATDYDFDFSKFPPYLKFDGVDDSMYTAASVDFTSTDKMTVFAGVHKANDTLYQTILETGVGSSNGSIGWRANNGTGGTYALLSQGTLMSQATTAASYVGPTTSVLTGISDISTDNATVRVNGVQVQYVATDQGTGNYANLVLNVGRRNNASLPFNGRLYQLAIKGKALSAAEISTVEAFINSRTKAF